MNVSRKVLCAAYALIAALALIGTWGNNIAYLGGSFVDANLRFWADTLASPASRSITADLFFLLLAVLVWMVLEARRLRMRGVWLYLIFGTFIAISVTVPIFLINRERALAAAQPGDTAGTLHPADVAGLILAGGLTLIYTAITLLRSAA